MTLGIRIFNIVTCGKMAFGIRVFNILTFGKMTSGITHLAK